MFTEKEFSLLYDGLECMRTLTTYESYRKEHELLVEKLKQLEKESSDIICYFYSAQYSDNDGNEDTMSGCVEFNKSMANVHPNVLINKLYNALDEQCPNKDWILISFNKI